MKRLVSTMLLAVTACSNAPSTLRPLPPESRLRQSVVYEVGGDLNFAFYNDNYEASIKYPVGVTRVELTGSDIPQKPKMLFTHAFPMDGRGSEVWCRITVDGKLVEEKKTVGSANNAMCMY